MGRWVVRAFTFVENGGSYDLVNEIITDKLLSAKVTLVLDDTSKFNFSLPYEKGKDLFPLKTYMRVLYYDDGAYIPYKKFDGVVSKRSLDATSGTYTFEAEGQLGLYKYMPPYRDYGIASIQEYIDTEQKRYRGLASAPYACDNPHTDLFAGHSEFHTSYGSITQRTSGDWSIRANWLVPAFNLNVVKTAKNAYEFLKTITKPGNYTFPTQYVTRLYLRWYEEEGLLYWDPVRGVNTQTIRYDRNLVSCTIDDIPYKTDVSASANGISYSEKSSEYPNPFYYSTECLKDKTDKAPYTQTDVQKEVQTILNAERVRIDAIGFDYHIVDNSVPFLNMGKFVDLVYYDGTSEQTVRAQITQITHDLLNPSNDRVRLGQIDEPLTAQVSDGTSAILDETIKDYVPLSGGEMSGAITYEGGTSLDGDELKIRDRYALACNLLDSSLIEQGAIDGSTGASVDWSARIRSGFTPIKPNTTYTVSWSGSAIPCMFYYSSSKTFVSASLTNTEVTSYTFTTPSGVGFVKFTWGKYSNANITPSDVSNVQLEKGSTASSYVPYTMDGVEVADALRYTKKTLTPLNASNFSGYGGCFWERIGMLKHLHIAVENSSAMTSWTQLFSAGAISGLNNRGWAWDVRGCAGSPQNNCSARIFADGSVSVMSGDKWAFVDYWYI